jgi:hypothetical protein
MSEIVFEITEDDTDGGFIARALGHAIVTEADTWSELKANVLEAVRCHFDEGKAPKVREMGWPRKSTKITKKEGTEGRGIGRKKFTGGNRGFNTRMEDRR